MCGAAQFYPRIARRVQGALIDGLVIPLCAIGSIVLLAYLGVEIGRAKAMTAILVIFVLEPLAVSWTGGSLGHHIVGVRVRRLSADRNLGLAAALVRFAVKTATGLPSFLVVQTTRRRQALHDLLARSVVVYRDGQSIPEHESLPELTRAEEHRAYVSVWRRVLVIATYWFGCYLTWAFSLVGLVNIGTRPVHIGIAAAVVTSIALVALPVLAVLGWKGLLYGARR